MTELHDRPRRLISLDAFRGLVILAMLIVNNLGDHESTGYFWKHADWIAEAQSQAYRAWWGAILAASNPLTFAFTQFPLFRHCTLADYVMPGFMLIIGIAIPFSVASSAARGTSAVVVWLRVLKRTSMLVLLGWILCYFRDQFAATVYGQKPIHVTLGMDVLQLLGVAYLVTRVLYALPPRVRAIAVVALFVGHWAVLRFWYQGPDIPRGTFTAEHNAISAIYSQPWLIWQSIDFGPFSMNWKGLMSVWPAAATMLMGTFVGDLLRDDEMDPRAKVQILMFFGCGCAALGILWGFDLPFNKPRWSPAYLLCVAGVGVMLQALLYLVIDVHQVRGWSWPLVVLGVNAIAAYFITILAKVLLLNTPRIDLASGTSMLVVKYGTLIISSVVIVLASVRFIVCARRHIGNIAVAPGVVTAVALAILWGRFVTMPTDVAASESVTSLANAAILSLKQSLGPWEGGWMFTVCFVLSWWLLLDLAHRRGIHWKL